MKTPALYVQNLNNHIITTDMLANCLYSSNKRAKNWRDKGRLLQTKRNHAVNFKASVHSPRIDRVPNF